MIYKITEPHDTVDILEKSPVGLVVFDVEPGVDLSKIAIAFKQCTECETVSVFGLNDLDEEYCYMEDCEGYLDGSYAALVIQGDKVVFALHRRNN